MEEQTPANHRKSHKASAAAHKRTEVYVLRDFKEYIGESMLIIFSVLLALFLTEIINSVHEKNQTRELTENIRNELIKNKKAEEEQYAYQAAVLKRIDSALTNPEMQKALLTNNEFHFGQLAPDGVVYRDLSKVAWQVGQERDITLKMDFKLVELLTDIYDQQSRIDKLEDKIANVLLSYDSRNPANVRQTLILLRDNYHGWAFDRAKNLIGLYDRAIKEMGE